jgi:clan AA aspartic protease (TIGR02281 family)
VSCSAAITALCLLLVCLPGAARAELYRWVDEKGGVHFTENIWEVPPGQRIEADQDALRREREPAQFNRVEIPPPAALSPGSRSHPDTSTPRSAAKQKKRVHRLRIKRAGHEIKLGAEINGSLVVPVIADTGASINTLPAWAAERLGLVIDDETPVIGMRGVGGQPMRVPLVKIDSVQIGTAVVHDVEMAVVSTMSEGLLGMPFFNHFRLSVDPAGGVMTLEEIDLGQVAGIYGGYDESMWRMKFGQVHGQLTQVENALERVPSTSYTSIIDKLEKEQAYWENQLEQLEERADQAGVPVEWREARE